MRELRGTRDVGKEEKDGRQGHLSEASSGGGWHSCFCDPFVATKVGTSSLECAHHPMEKKFAFTAHSVYGAVRKKSVHSTFWEICL